MEVQQANRSCPTLCGRFVQKKYKTLISLAAISFESVKGLLSPNNWLFGSAETFTWTAHSLHVIADAAASGPALSRAIHSVRHLTRAVLEHGEVGLIHNFRKIRKIAFELFSLSGDVCQIVSGLHNIGVIKIIQHVPGLQVTASIITSISAVVRISNACNNKKFTSNEKMIVIAKEIVNIALSTILVVALITQPHIIVPCIVATSLLFLTLDLLEYAYVKQEKESLYSKPDPQ